MGGADWIGAIGVGLLLLAFALNNRGRLQPSSRVYQGMNAVGAGLACTASWVIDYWPFVVLEGSWCAVAVVALIWPVSAPRPGSAGSGPGPGPRPG